MDGSARPLTDTGTPTPPTPTPRGRLIDAAVELFEERGFAEVSVGDICGRADIKKGSFYHFFDSKEELLLSAIEQYATRHTQMLRTMVDPGLPIRKQLQLLVEALAQTHGERQRTTGLMPGCTMGNLVLELAGRDAKLRGSLARVFEVWKGALAELYTQACDQGELRGGDPQALAEGTLATIQGATLLAKVADDPSVLARIVKGALDALQWTKVELGHDASAGLGQ